MTSWRMSLSCTAYLPIFLRLAARNTRASATLSTSRARVRACAPGKGTIRPHRAFVQASAGTSAWSAGTIGARHRLQIKEE
jgi:hypothetical protein